MSQHRMHRGRRALRCTRVALAVLVAATLLDAGHPVQAQVTAVPTTLGGIQGRAAASGVHLAYAPKQLLPIPSLVDLGAPDALATIASGPTTFARASVLDPGDLIANPDAALALMVGSGYPAGSIPPYPYRVTANSGTDDPPAESSPAPGLTARVEAGDGASAAHAAIGESDAPGILRLGTASAEATTETDGSTVTVRARSQFGDVNLLGLLTIDAVVTELTATSDGTETQLEGGTRLTGASFLGQPVTIDAEGVHLADDAASPLGGLLGSLVGTVNDLLASAGLRVTLAGPVEQGEGRTGELASSGLRIDFDVVAEEALPVLATLLDALPPLGSAAPGLPSIEDVLQAVRANHIGSVEIGRGVVSLSARPGYTPEPLPPFSGGSGTPSAVTPSVGTGAISLPPVAAPAPTVAAPETVAVAVDPVAEVPTGAGIAGLVALALLSAPFIGDRLSAMALAILGAGGATTCPLEEP